MNDTETDIPDNHYGQAYLDQDLPDIANQEQPVNQNDGLLQTRLEDATQIDERFNPAENGVVASAYEHTYPPRVFPFFPIVPSGPKSQNLLAKVPDKWSGLLNGNPKPSPTTQVTK